MSEDEQRVGLTELAHNVAANTEMTKKVYSRLFENGPVSDVRVTKASVSRIWWFIGSSMTVVGLIVSGLVLHAFKVI